MQYHHLLEKQINKTLSGPQKYDPAVQQMLQLVSQSYHSYEREQEQAEKAFQQCEKEYQNILSNQQLQNNIYSQLVKKLRDAIIANDPQAASFIGSEDNVLFTIISYLEKQIEKRKETEAELIRAKEQAEEKLLRLVNNTPTH